MTTKYTFHQVRPKLQYFDFSWICRTACYTINRSRWNMSLTKLRCDHGFTYSLNRPIYIGGCDAVSAWRHVRRHSSMTSAEWVDDVVTVTSMMTQDVVVRCGRRWTLPVQPQQLTDGSSDWSELRPIGWTQSLPLGLPAAILLYKKFNKQLWTLANLG